MPIIFVLFYSLVALLASPAYTTPVEPGLNLIIAVSGTALKAEQKELLQELRPGGVILLRSNIVNEEQTCRLVMDIKKSVSGRTGVADLPLIYIDQEGGRINRLNLNNAPSAGEIGRSGKETYARKTGLYYGYEATLRGIGVVLAPVLDLCSPDEGGVIGDRSFGTDPELSWCLGWAFAKGIIAGGALPVVKHFPGHGSVVGDSHKQSVGLDVSDAEMQTILEPFCRAVEEDIPAIMVGHIACRSLNPQKPNEPASLSPAVITGLLREKWGYNGVIITDDLNMKAIRDSLEVAVIKSLRAGCDAAMVCDGNPERLRSIVKALKRELEGDPRFALMLAKSHRRLDFFRSKLDYESGDGLPYKEVTTPKQGQEKAPEVIEHLIRKNETLWDLNVKYGVPIESIKKANGMETDVIKEGKTIFIPTK